MSESFLLSPFFVLFYPFKITKMSKTTNWIMNFIFSFPDLRQRRCLTQFRSWAEAALRSQPRPSLLCQDLWPRSWGARASPRPLTSWSSSSGQMSRRRSLASWPRGPQTPRVSHVEVTSTPWPPPRYWPLLDMTEGKSDRCQGMSRITCYKSLVWTL